MKRSEQSKAQAHFQYKSDFVSKTATFESICGKERYRFHQLCIVHTKHTGHMSKAQTAMLLVKKNTFVLLLLRRSTVSKVVNSIIENHCNLAFRKAVVTEILDAFLLPCYLTPN